MKRLGIHRVKLPARRSGTSLGEVVVSLLIMSIGVISLATLFPISVLRSVQATQLTNATNLRYNVEALFGPNPQLYSIAKHWKPGVSYAVGDLVTPTDMTSVKSPPAIFYCNAAHTSGNLEPAWNFQNTSFTAEGAVPHAWITLILQNYVIDPLGEALVEPTYRNVSPFDFFGNLAGSPPTPRQVIRAFSGFSTSFTTAMADDLGTLPDSWVTQLESNRVSYTAAATSCTLGDVQGSVSIPTTSDAFTPTRIVLFDSIGKVSHVRPIYQQPSGTLPTLTFDWTAPAGVVSAGALPLNFTPERARVETKERRYTWMLSVRRAFSGASYMDVVVFFKRTFSGLDERLYPVTFSAAIDFGVDAAPGIAGIDDDGNGKTDWTDAGHTIPDPLEIGWPGSDDAPRNWVVVQYDASATRPFIKKGGYVTDADNLQWYRVIDVIEGDTINGYTPSVVVTKAGITLTGLNSLYPVDSVVTTFTTPRSLFLRLEKPVAQSGPQPTAGIPNGYAMMMRGVVEVFPIRAQLTTGD